jgi:hypothetical protein
MTTKNPPVRCTLTCCVASKTPGCATDSHLKKIPVISIIDDDSSVRTAVESLVKSLGFIAHTFASAEEFLQSRHVDETCCLISDVHMPHVSGIDLQVICSLKVTACRSSLSRPSPTKASRRAL